MTLDFSNSLILLALFCCLLLAVTAVIIRTKSLVHLVMLLAIYSTLICCIYLLMDAPDVAMTEAAIGACLTTVIFFTILPRIESESYILSKANIIGSAMLCTLLGGCLLYIGYDMVNYGQYAAVHQGDSAFYLKHTTQDIDLPSYVASILASYRGFDTLGETTVIMMAGLAVLFIMNIRRGGQQDA